MVIAIFVSPVMIDSAAVARVFAQHAAATDKPLAACLLGKSQGEVAVEILREAGVPNYRFPEEAAQALAGLAQITELREREVEAAPRFRVQKAKAARAIEAALAEGRETLKGTELHDLFSAYGIPIVPSLIVRNREEALQAVVPPGDTPPRGEGAKGVGKALMERIMQRYGDIHQQVLIADDHAEPFYRKLGFTLADGTKPMWIYDRAADGAG